MNQRTEQIFQALIQTEEQFTFVAIPFPPREAWGARPRYHVTGTIDGHPVRGCLGALKQDYFLRLSAVWLRQNKIAPGASVTVQLMPEDPQKSD